VCFGNPRRRIMTNWLPAIWAAAIGAGGSLAYFSALYYGFVQAEDVLRKLWPTVGKTTTSRNVLRVFWFTLIGAAVSFTFQLPESNLAPIQAFIIGTTWPSIVAQVLTGRQADTPESIKSQIASLLGQ
jgi:hypothetical protein